MLAAERFCRPIEETMDAVANELERPSALVSVGEPFWWGSELGPQEAFYLGVGESAETVREIQECSERKARCA